eukprot:TRINITY_DN1832_c0_g1_i1.p1 TRINITY_DN1832_c0_g1~~TRINITY_DN1832_c0_g1_i1.p1  ORF type:complete len:836 (+),score=248.88 TRINITY_DN1832_c0_g1_i1:50-2509(+)
MGTPIDSKLIEIEPKNVAMTKTHVLAASDNYFTIWQYQTSQGEGFQRVPPSDSTIDVIRFIDDDEDAKTKESLTKESADPIIGLAARDSCVYVSRVGGSIQQYLLPTMSNFAKYSSNNQIVSMYPNCNNTKLACVDMQGTMSLLELISTEVPASPPLEEDGKIKTRKQLTSRKNESKIGKGNWRTGGKLLDFERKPIWQVYWSDDNPDVCAIMEKMRMYILRGVEPEESTVSSGYICEFNNLSLRCALLDEILAIPESPERESVFEYETLALKEARGLLANESVSMDDAISYITKHSHPRLWECLAEAALKKLDFAVAEKGFSKAQQYSGLTLVKKLKTINDAKKQKAAIAFYFKRYNEAEEIYQSIDRKDLAIDMRIVLGDWFGVVRLLQGSGLAGSDTLVIRAFDEIGMYYKEHKKWRQAAQYFSQSNNHAELVECYAALENWEGMSELAKEIQEGDPLLINIGQRFELVGLSDPAADSYEKAGDSKKAVECCIALNNWDRGIALAERTKYKNMDVLLSQYADSMLEKGKILNAVQLFRKAAVHNEAAKLLYKMAKEESTHNLKRAKQLSVLAALEAEANRKKIIEQGKEKALAQKEKTSGTTDKLPANATASEITAKQGIEQAKATLDGLMAEQDSSRRDKTLEIGWRYAEAFHFLLLAQSQFYKGFIDASMKTSMRLVEYEDILSPKVVFSLIALTAYYNKHYLQSSRALTRLETMEDLTDDEKSLYFDLSFAIFTKHPPVDPKTYRKTKCPSCESEIKEYQTQCGQCHLSFPPCVASGRPISDQRYITCRTCKHQTHEVEVQARNNCALCYNKM